MLNFFTLEPTLNLTDDLKLLIQIFTKPLHFEEVFYSKLLDLLSYPPHSHSADNNIL